MENTNNTYIKLFAHERNFFISTFIICTVIECASTTPQYQAQLLSANHIDGNTSQAELIELNIQQSTSSSVSSSSSVSADHLSLIVHPAAPDSSSEMSANAEEPEKTVTVAPTSSTASSAHSSDMSVSSERSFAVGSASSELASQSSAASISSVENSSIISSFPPFIKTVWPIAAVPNWGAMRTPDEWNRTYDQLQPSDFVPIPHYDLSVLTTPMATLTQDLTPDNIAKITAKLFYSTRYFGAYDLDAGEFSGNHPAVDLKLARGTPVGSIAGGLVYDIRTDDSGLGLHVLIEHKLPDGETFFSIYGHLDSVSVSKGETVTPGQTVGRVGLTGNTTAPHLHLQIDLDDGTNPHVVYYTPQIPSAAEAAKHVVNPITFIRTHEKGVE